MNAMSSDAMNISFLVRNFAERVTGVRDAIVVSADGLLMAMSAGLTRESADRFAAAASGLIGVIIEMEYGFIFVTGIGEGSSMAVMTDGNCDVGLVGYEMARLVEQCGPVLTPELRAELQGALAR